MFLCKTIISTIALNLKEIKPNKGYHLYNLIRINRTYCISNKYYTMPAKGVIEDWRLNFSPSALIERAKDLANSTRKVYDSVGAVPDKDVHYSNTLKVIADVDGEYSSSFFILTSAQHISPLREIRDASTEAEKILSAFNVEISMRKDVFNKLVILEKEKNKLNPEAKRYLEKLIIKGKRNGLHLSEELQGEVAKLKNKINDLSIQLRKNVGEESRILEFSGEELIGLPEDFLQNLKKADSGKYEVTLKYPDFFPIIEKCRNPETRRLIFIAFNSRCKEENAPLLDEILKARHKLANLLGYPLHSEYQTEIMMAKNRDNVMKFLEELAQKLKTLFEEERKYMLELKEAECKELGIPFDGKLHAHDFKFYTAKVENIKYAVDHNKLQEYFPLPTVTEGLLSIYQELLGLKFKEVENAEVWHESVQMFSVEDASSGELLGYFFMDLFPRTGKYGHACAMECQPGYLLPSGARQVAVAAMIANFTKPQKDKPSLLTSNEVQTYFHEFGHIMHYICSRSDICYFSGFSVETDFVEAPSQMLENWCWEVEPLKRMSSHYVDKSEIPEELLNALIKSRLANTGYAKLRQICFSLFDMAIHSCPECDVNKKYCEVLKTVMDIEQPEETHMASSFGHLFGEYDARYYSYMWSEVYSIDMFYTRFKDGKILDPKVGKEYREKILQPGGSKDAIELLTDFLGRPPTQEAYLHSLGLKA